MILILIIAVLLVLIVLAQNSKGGGLSSQFGGSGASNIIGVKKTTDLLEKLTWGFAIGIFVLSLAVNVLAEKPQADDASSPNLDKAQQEQPANPSLDLQTPVNTKQEPSGDKSSNKQDKNKNPIDLTK